jgi:ribosomal protein S18 acetylase RimI-like enzyme
MRAVAVGSYTSSSTSSSVEWFNLPPMPERRPRPRIDAMRRWVRPDGRCFVFGEPDEALPLGRRIYAIADEADEARVGALAGLGFTFHRRELVLRIPTDPAGWNVAMIEPPPGIAFVRADAIEEKQLRLLDDLLRQDVPGTDGWKWSPDEFHEETYDSPDFDPATYLVAADEGGNCLGIVRVWMKPGAPRLGFIGVRADWRRRGVARALLAEALSAVRQCGASEVSTEVDQENNASKHLLFSFGGQEVGATLELIREAAGSLQFRLRQSVPEDAEAIAIVQIRSAQVGFAGFRPADAMATLDPAARVPLWRERLPLVAETDDGIVGFAHFGPNEAEPVGEIYRFFVAPECWGKGVGQALMRRALEQLQALGFDEAIVWVHADNRRARHFYEAGGWRPDGVERDEEAFGHVVKELRHRISIRAATTAA